eukprot:scaffold181226_cov29-Tisochrysis_lutea.AAC.2
MVKLPVICASVWLASEMRGVDRTYSPRCTRPRRSTCDDVALYALHECPQKERSTSESRSMPSTTSTRKTSPIDSFLSRMSYTSSMRSPT